MAVRKRKRRSPGKGCEAYRTKENMAVYRCLHRAQYPSREETVQAAVDFYANRLMREHLYKGSGSWGRHREEIGVTFEYELYDYVARHPDGGPFYYFRQDPPDQGQRILKGLFLSRNPNLDIHGSYIERNGTVVQISGVVNRHLNRLWRSVMASEVTDYFTTEVILDLVSQNPRYPFVAAGQAARAAILKEIPDSMPALFPMARSIRRHFILHVGPTNSGKTHDAVLDCMAAERGIYLAPLRLLAMEIAEKMNKAGVICSMITGEEEQILPGAKHVSSTVEMMDFSWYDTAVIDECQMIADEDRGWAWTQAILGVAAGKVHVCMAPEAESLIIRLIEECEDTWEKEEHQRVTPLKMDRYDFEFPDDVRAGDALVVFSRRSVLQAASMLEDAGKKVSVIYGGLPYPARQAETEKFAKGETKIVVATDAIGMGMNLPVKRIVFLETQKFDGHTKRELTAAEVKQIAGRAGRRGMAEIGFVNALYDKRSIAAKLKAPVEPLVAARTMMPPGLIHMDRPLSLIIRDWANIVDHPPYEKASLDRQLKLCEYLEECCPLDREEMYRAITVPFDESVSDLMGIWRKAMRNRLFGRPVLGELIVCIAREGDSLETLEGKYKRLDLFYALLRAFPDEEEAEAQKAYILDCKTEVSQAIIQKLKQDKQTYKRCRSCGKILPWNYPYRLCEACHHFELLANETM